MIPAASASIYAARGAMLLCVIFWSTSGLFISFLDWHPLVISCLRSALAALFMLLVKGSALFKLEVWRNGMRKVGGMPVLAVAALSSSLTKICYVSAVKLGSPVNAILLQHSAPVWAALFAGILTGERLSRSQKIALVMVLGGIMLFLFDGLHYGRFLGDFLALLAGITFALGMTTLRMQKEGSPALALFFSHLIAVFAGLPFLVIKPPVWTHESLLAILFLGFVQVGAASVLYAAAIKRLVTMDVMFIAQLEPVLNPVWLFVFCGEIPSRYALAGGLTIIAAVFISLRPLTR